MNKWMIKIVLVTGLLLPCVAIAGNGSGGHSGQALMHTSQAAGHATASGAAVVSGVVAIPLAGVAAIGVVAGEAGSALAASADGKPQPLPVADEVITAGPSPEQMLATPQKKQ